MAIRNGTGLPLDPDIVVCINTGWSWEELMAAPVWVVEDLKVYWRKKGAVERERRR